MTQLEVLQLAPRAIGSVVETHCHGCGHTQARVLPFRYAFHGRHLEGVTCLRCTLIFVDPQPSAEEIASMYSAEYFTESSDTVGAHGPAAYMEMAAQGNAERAKAAHRLDRMVSKPARGRWLEVGCGPGFLLAEMQKLGWSAHGIELSEFGARHARETLGLDVRQGEVTPGHFVRGSFDAIFLGDVLEHLPEPVATLRVLHEWLAPDGRIVIAVPATMNLASAQLGLWLYARRGRWKTLRIPPYHLFEYTPRTLPILLAEAGFEVRELRQSAVPLNRMGLRGSPLENAGKFALQSLAHLTSTLFNRGGDRLLAIAAPR
ncbi:MAG: class I SAM-dependent methyltransferase [Candidatus Eisenbacteria bacterium]|nr:class I SAM-dependent methyltransferase [Candidatus Eisenbacteria bacterium]